MKKLLLLLDQRILPFTQGRFIKIVRDLEREFDLSVATNKPQSAKYLASRLSKSKVFCCSEAEKPLMMKDRDAHTKKFIQTFHDINLPTTDFPFWKMVAFDDFLWNFSTHLSAPVPDKFDAMLMPFPSYEDSAPSNADLFYSANLYKAREGGTPIFGFPMFHPAHNSVLYKFIFDDVLNVEDPVDQYCLSTVEDPYKNYWLQSPLPKDKVNVLIMNHVNQREQLKSILNIILSLPVPVTISICLLNYAVKELHEQEIFKDIFYPVLKDKIKEISFIMLKGMPRMIACADAFITTRETALASFAQNLGTTVFVGESEVNAKHSWFSHKLFQKNSSLTFVSEVQKCLKK